MAKRAVDLSVEELAVLGAKAARRAAQESLTAGLTISGTIDTYEMGQAVSSLAELHPSGVVTLVQEDSDVSIEHDAPAARRGKDVD